MSLDVTQQKIRRLLEELRSWETGEKKHTVHELARMFDLDVFVIGQLARSEGLVLRIGYSDSDEGKTDVDPEASTLDLDPEAINKALDEPEEDPAYEDKDTGVWRKKPTGEWELVNDKPKD